MVVRILLFALILGIVAEGDAAAWPALLVALPLAAAASALLRAGALPRPRPIGAAAFVPYFFAASLRGGVDIALRALARRPRIDPGMLTYRTKLPAGAPRVVFADIVSLLPGTLCADLRDDELTVHTLDVALGTAGLADLERHVAGVFGEGIAP